MPKRSRQSYCILMAFYWKKREIMWKDRILIRKRGNLMSESKVVKIRQVLRIWNSSELDI